MKASLADVRTAPLKASQLLPALSGWAPPPQSTALGVRAARLARKQRGVVGGAVSVRPTRLVSGAADRHRVSVTAADSRRTGQPGHAREAAAVSARGHNRKSR